MTEEQKIITIEKRELVDKVKEFKDGGYRLVQICCAKIDGFELSYSFDKDYQFVHLRFSVATVEDEIPSVSSVYWNAFFYENELHDLFGLRIKDMAIDYKGNLYKTAAQYPFGSGAADKKE